MQRGQPDFDIRTIEAQEPFAHIFPLVTLPAGDSTEYPAVSRQHQNLERHRANRMSGTTETRVIDPNAVLHPVQHPFTHGIPPNILLGYRGYRPVYRQIVMAGGDNEIDIRDDAVAVH